MWAQKRIEGQLHRDTSSAWVLKKEILFVYDGWNVIKEITRMGGSDTNRYFVWGLDISQTLQDAGGVGGLLAMVEGSNTYHYCFDANGNVGQLVNGATGVIEAHYEFDPFGNIISKNGSMADDNPFRFSTQYFDEETGLIAYKFRYYDPEMGRWLNRDPIGEKGGINLYTMVGNNSVNKFDPFGLQSCCDVKEKQMSILYDSEKECCTSKGVFSKQDRELVKVCVRPAQIPFGNIATKFGLYHMWIYSPYAEVGLGPIQGGIPGGGDATPDNPFNETSVNDHSNESRKADSQCFYVPVNLCCINKALEGGPTGKSCVSQNCNEWAKNVIEDCGGSFVTGWKYLKGNKQLDIIIDFSGFIR